MALQGDIHDVENTGIAAILVLALVFGHLFRGSLTHGAHPRPWAFFGLLLAGDTAPRQLS
jgi:hypothetical protein